MKATTERIPEAIIAPQLRRKGAGSSRIRRFAVHLLIANIVLGALNIGSNVSLAAGDVALIHASLRDDTIELAPLKASFQIPPAWLDWHRKYHDNVHLSARDLAKARVANGEWDNEYADIINALLPFNNCVAHVGAEGWGPNGYSFSDVQMRVYLVDLSPNQISQRVARHGPSRALRFAKKAAVTCASFDHWQRVTLSYPLWYTDYGGTANIDVFSRAIGNQTAVLVFMYAEPTPEMRREVATIVQSFRWKR